MYPQMNAAYFLLDCAAAFFVLPLAAIVWDPERATTDLIYRWAFQWFRPRVYKTSQSFKPWEGRAMYLCNHRTWTDFFLDRVLTGYRGYYLSRWKVALIPIAPLLCAIGGSCRFFYRGRSREENKKKLYQLFDSWPKDQGMIVYPEGKRNLRLEPLELRTGCIRYAWDSILPVQVMIASGKEGLINEFQMTSRTSKGIYVCYGDPVFPEDYDDYEEFLRDVYLSWETCWDSAYHQQENSTPLDPLKTFERSAKIQLSLWRTVALHAIRAAAVTGGLGLIRSLL